MNLTLAGLIADARGRPGVRPLDVTDALDLADTLTGHPAAAWCLTLRRAGQR